MGRRTRRLKGGVGTPVAPVNQTPLTPQGPVVPMFQNPVPQLPAVPPPPPLPPAALLPPRHPGIGRQTASRGLVAPPSPKMIKQGSYGCLYRPPLKCGLSSGVVQEANEVTKLITKTNAAKELEEADKLRPIDGEQKYFVYSGKSCDFTVNAANPEINRCRAVRGRPSAKLLIMPDGGVDLDDYSPKPSEYAATFAGLRNLLVGLQALHTGGYAHFDIKPGNMVARMDGGVCIARFIDFGLMRSHNPYPEEDHRYEYDYPWYSFEIKFLSTKFDQTKIDDYWKEYVRVSLGYQPESRDNSVWHETSTNLIPGMMTMARSFQVYQEFNRDKATVGSKILTQNDVYALGRSLGQIYYRLTSHSPDNGDIYFKGSAGARVKLTPSPSAGDLAVLQLTQAEYDVQLNLSEFSKLWYTMCEKMMHPQPIKRITLAAAIAYFDLKLAPAIPIYFP